MTECRRQRWTQKDLDHLADLAQAAGEGVITTGRLIQELTAAVTTLADRVEHLERREPA